MRPIEEPSDPVRPPDGLAPPGPARAFQIREVGVRDGSGRRRRVLRGGVLGEAGEGGGEGGGGEYAACEGDGE